MGKFDLMTAVRRHGRWILAGLLLGLLVAGVLSYTAVRQYTSSTQLFIGTTGADATSDAYEGNLFSQQRAASYAQVLTSRDLAQDVIDATSLPLTARELAAKVTATPLPDTVVLDVRVTDTSPERAQEIAVRLTEQFSARVAEIETPRAGVEPTVRVEVIQAADFNPDPISPDTLGNLWRGAGIGLVVGLLVTLLRARLDRSVRDVDDAEEATGAAVVGRLFEKNRRDRRQVEAPLAGQSATAEAYRALRVDLRYFTGDRPPKLVVLAGPVGGEGASTVAVDLAVSLARAGNRVTLIDADMRRPRVQRLLDLPAGPGLADYLVAWTDLRSIVQPWGDGRLEVIGAGALPADPEAALGSPRMRALLDTLREQRDVVVVDAPPLLPVVDAAVVSSMADTCLLVARYGHTRREHLAEAAAAVARVRVPSLGVVINRIPRRARELTAASRPYEAETQQRRNPLPVASGPAVRHDQPLTGPADGRHGATGEE